MLFAWPWKKSAVFSFQSVDFTVILGIWAHECALRISPSARSAQCRGPPDLVRPITRSFYARKQCVCGHLLLHKYTKLYSNAEPILSEVDVFEIRIPLKKSVVGTEKSVIQTKKITLEQLLEECKRRSYNITVVNHLKKIHSSALSCNMNVHMYIESLRGECYHHILRIDFQR